jgi:hypothetical protein
MLDGGGGRTILRWFVGWDETAGDVDFVGTDFLRGVETGEDTLGDGGGDGGSGYCADEGFGEKEG